MISTRHELKPPPKDAGLTGRPPAGSTRLVWGVIVLAVVVIAACAAFFLRRLNRLQTENGRLTQQVQQTRQDLVRMTQRSEVALHQAEQAALSARLAAGQRDQAEKAAAQSNEEAGLARQKAEAAQNRAATAEQQAQRYRQQREDELNSLQQALGQIADTRRTAMGLIMTLGSNSIRFDFDKSELRPENREILSRIAGILSMLKGYQISVFGYTDDIGTDAYNLKLSERRAQAVRAYLIKAGIKPGIISSKGFGKSDPRVAGNSAAARAANRRVEIAIVDSRLKLQGLASPKK